MNERADQLPDALARYRDEPHPARGYPDLHDHVLALASRRPSCRRRRADQQRHPHASAGALAISRRHRRKRAQGVSVHASRPTARARITTSPCWWPGWPPIRTSIVSASAGRSNEIGAAWVKALAAPVEPRVVTDAPCQEICIHRRCARQAGQRARRPAGADLDAGLRQRAVSFRRPLHHQGSRHRPAERRQLSRPAQSAAPARHESIGRIARRHLLRIGSNTRRAASRCPARSWSAVRR